MAEQPVNLSTAIYLGVFSRAEQRVLQAIFKAIAEGGGRCVATLAMLARDSNTSKPTTRNAIAQAVAIGLLEKTERRSYCAVSLPNILSYGLMGPHGADIDVYVRGTRWRVPRSLAKAKLGLQRRGAPAWIRNWAKRKRRRAIRLAMDDIALRGYSHCPEVGSLGLAKTGGGACTVSLTRCRTGLRSCRDAIKLLGRRAAIDRFQRYATASFSSIRSGRAGQRGGTTECEARLGAKPAV